MIQLENKKRYIYNNIVMTIDNVRNKSVVYLLNYLSIDAVMTVFSMLFNNDEDTSNLTLSMTIIMFTFYCFCMLK